MTHPQLEAATGHGYGSSKTYAHSVGLSATFRQWRATSHCRFLHGYALQVKIEYGCNALDDRNWCEDFGSLKPLKAWLEETFDHKTLVAEDDPALPWFCEMAEPRHRRELYQPEPIQIGPLVQLVVVPSVGVESFSRLIFDKACALVSDPQRIWVERVTVSEHEGNSAWYGRTPRDGTNGVVGISEQQARRLIDQAIQQRESSRNRTGI
jgi:6-pyruvoyltetrahydropterin/6-carboxytetrahydropterin synthase